jgi:small subunit ribosomal protein S21
MVRKKVGEAITARPLEVKINGSFEEGYRRFKSEFQKERIIAQLKEKSYFEKPSEKKRRKIKENREKNLLLEMRERLINSGEWERRQKKRLKKKQERADQRVKRESELFGAQE